MDTSLWITMLEERENFIEMYNQMQLLSCRAEALCRRIGVRVLTCFDSYNFIKESEKYMNKMRELRKKAEEAYSLFKIEGLADCIKEMKNLLGSLSVLDRRVQGKVNRLKKKAG